MAIKILSSFFFIFFPPVKPQTITNYFFIIIFLSHGGHKRSIETVLAHLQPVAEYPSTCFLALYSDKIMAGLRHGRSCDVTLLPVLLFVHGQDARKGNDSSRDADFFLAPRLLFSLKTFNYFSFQKKRHQTNLNGPSEVGGLRNNTLNLITTATGLEVVAKEKKPGGRTHLLKLKYISLCI